VNIHIDVKSKRSIGSHFGTFPLADEGREQPVIDLQKALQVMKIPASDFITMKEGTFEEF
jgi:hypothetical protein